MTIEGEIEKAVQPLSIMAGRYFLGSDSVFDGSIDTVKVWDYEITDAQCVSFNTEGRTVVV